MIALSCFPCADVKSQDSITHTLNEVVSSHENHSHKSENDLCPPFCICNCCGSLMLSYQPTNFFSFPLLSKSIITPLHTYKSILSSSFYVSIWQPPQIA